LILNIHSKLIEKLDTSRKNVFFIFTFKILYKKNIKNKCVLY
jgi:hypothetical protein